MNIFLFHRDLRLTDNTTLIHQLNETKIIIPIFIFTPEQINPKKNKYFSNNSVQFMIESLHELSDDIKKKNGKLYFFKGDNLDILKKINKLEKINSIGFNIDYTPYAKKRDTEIREWCIKNNIKCYEKEDYVLYDIIDGQTCKKDNTPYLVYTPFRNHCMNDLTVRPINHFNNFIFEKNKKLDDLIIKDIDNFYTDNPDINVRGGRNNGLKILSNIGKFNTYQKNRDFLTYKTTFLGAYNHFSCISIREVYHKIVDKLGQNNGIINELHWRDFYVNITYYFPHVLHGQVSGKNISFKKKYEKIKTILNNKWFTAWCTGKTYIPIIDAAMNQLNTTGFMHNRCRMIVCSFLYKDMHIDWRLGEKYFATKLVDYDAMSNSGGHQWCFGNGTDAQPWFRIFNPWSQQEKFDGDCEYIKTWLPELNDVPPKDIHNWFNSEINEKWLKNGIKYDKPILDHDKERLKCISLFKKGLN